MYIKSISLPSPISQIRRSAVNYPSIVRAIMISRQVFYYITDAVTTYGYHNSRGPLLLRSQELVAVEGIKAKYV